jgi:hypothetical protein
MSEFLADPRGRRWKEGQFNNKLQKRLGTTYESYIATIDELRKTINVFKQRLKLDPSGQPQFDDEANFRKHYKRLDFSLKKADYDDLMNCLRRNNSSLHRMTTQTISLEGLHTSRNSYGPLMPKFDVISEHAQGFHSAIESGWHCPCHANHGVHLRLEHRMNQIQNEDSDQDESVQEPFHVVFRYDHHELTSGNPSPTAPKPWNWEEVDVEIILRDEFSPSNPNACASSTKGVRFAKQTQTAIHTALSPTRNMQHIQSLCVTIGTLKSTKREMCLSLLANEDAKKKHNVIIYPAKSPPQDTINWTIRDLHSLLADARFARRYRLELAVTLASSVLQLHETPWLGVTWTNNDILFINRSGVTAYTDPFVLKKTSNSVQVAPANLPSAIRLTIRNQTLYALGVSLIELWYGQRLSDMHAPEDGLAGTGDAHTDLMTEISTADRLVEDLYNDAGAKYAGAVRRCIRCDFDHRSSTLKDVAFQKAVFAGVVVQLKENFDYLFQPQA